MKKAILLMLACVCALALGCNNGPKKPDDLPKLIPTTIVVQYDDGTPVAEATVALRNPDANAGRTWNLTGVTDAQGKVALKTDGQWDGAPAGTYQVMVTKEVSELDQGTEPGASVIVKSVTRFVDQKYNNPNTSGITVEVKEGGEAEHVIKVGEKVEQDAKMA
ncbi:MAG: carboxypeptidase regulatory-like domain-containing protein [Thermoguttaceae bacterium]|nr:carboxypeptidase regulatory-like domain-containing protein [Thermoguttaceae bacterium]